MSKRNFPREIMADLAAHSKLLERAVNAMRPVRRDEIEELKWLISQAEEKVGMYAKAMYEQGKGENGLFQ
jgi:hypothetical protein